MERKDLWLVIVVLPLVALLLVAPLLDAAQLDALLGGLALVVQAVHSASLFSWSLVREWAPLQFLTDLQPLPRHVLASFS